MEKYHTNETFSNNKKVPIFKSILLLDYFPWYYGKDKEIANALSSIYGKIYTGIIGQEVIENALEEMFIRIGREHSVDMIIIPLMAGAVTLQAAKRYFKEVPIVSLPISRHPWVTFSCDEPQEFSMILDEYKRYNCNYEKYLDYLILEKKPKNLLILDETHDEGHILKMVKEYIESKVDKSVNILTAALINETNGTFNKSPNGVDKVSCLDYYAIESLSNTRNYTHLYYLLDNKYQQDVPYICHELLEFWKDSRYGKVYNMYSSPKWFEHEKGKLFYNEEYRNRIFSLISNLDIKAKKTTERKALMDCSKIEY